MAGKFEESKISGMHYQLSRLAGDWAGTIKTWFEPGKLADESPIAGTMRIILGGRFILHEYEGSLEGKPLEGMAIYGYHMGLEKFQSAWIDSFHNGTAIMFSEGTRGQQDMNILGSYVYITPEKIHTWGWRTNIEVVSDDQVKISAYNVSPEGEEALATEIVYQKVK